MSLVVVVVVVAPGVFRRVEGFKAEVQVVDGGEVDCSSRVM